jgi:hypothetical protein
LSRAVPSSSVSFASISVSFRQQCVIVPEHHALLPKAYTAFTGLLIGHFEVS